MNVNIKCICCFFQSVTNWRNINIVEIPAYPAVVWLVLKKAFVRLRPTWRTLVVLQRICPPTNLNNSNNTSSHFSLPSLSLSISLSLYLSIFLSIYLSIFLLTIRPSIYIFYQFLYLLISIYIIMYSSSSYIFCPTSGRWLSRGPRVGWSGRPSICPPRTSGVGKSTSEKPWIIGIIGILIECPG